MRSRRAGATQYERARRRADLERFVEHVHADHLPHTVLIDCTASDEVARALSASGSRRGIHVVTPNKKANSGRLGVLPQPARGARAGGGAHYLYEATVGAGLPVIQTLRDLRETGDEISSIEGIFSGTLAYLFNVYDGKQAVLRHRARREGSAATPSPIRATTCRAWTSRASSSSSAARWAWSSRWRTCKVESLVPAGLEKGSIDEFLTRLPQLRRRDARALRGRARASGKVLRYVGRLDRRRQGDRRAASSSTAKHAFANIALTDNVVRFATRALLRQSAHRAGPGRRSRSHRGRRVRGPAARVPPYLGARL